MHYCCAGPGNWQAPEQRAASPTGGLSSPCCLITNACLGQKPWQLGSPCGAHDALRNARLYGLPQTDLNQNTPRPLAIAAPPAPAPQVAAFLVAGFETTAHSVSFALYEIARHPEVQQKLAAELAGAGLLWRPGGWASHQLQLMLRTSDGQCAYHVKRCRERVAQHLHAFASKSSSRGAAAQFPSLQASRGARWSCQT